MGTTAIKVLHSSFFLLQSQVHVRTYTYLPTSRALSKKRSPAVCIFKTDYSKVLMCHLSQHKDMRFKFKAGGFVCDLAGQSWVFQFEAAGFVCDLAGQSWLL